MKKLSFLLAGALLVTGGMGVGALANSHLQEIKAHLNKEMKVRVNGEVIALTDANGNAVLPISYNGTTYLPVRSISTALDIPVHYDAATREVILGERLEGISVNQEDYNNTLYSKDPSDTTFGGKNYAEVLISRPGTNIEYTAFTPDGKYQKLYLQIAALGSEIKDVRISDNDTHATLKTIESLSPGDGMQTIEIDITGVKNIAINLKKERDSGFIIPLTTSYYK